jgi:hypothetical protein
MRPPHIKRNLFAKVSKDIIENQMFFNIAGGSQENDQLM